MVQNYSKKSKASLVFNICFKIKDDKIIIININNIKNKYKICFLKKNRIKKGLNIK